MKGWKIEPGEMLLLIFLCAALLCSLLVLLWKLIGYYTRVQSIQYLHGS